MATQIRIAQDPDADAVLSEDPFALLVGMLLDQQYPMEHAFRGPWKLKSRFGNLDVDAIASAEPEAFADLAATPPAIHRYGRSMAGRVQQLAAVVRDEYGGHAERIWTEAKDTDELLDRLRRLPGYGDQKARIFAALVGKQLGVRPAGWQEAIGPYAEDGSYRSVADVVDAESLQKVREFKQAAKAEAKAKAGAKPAAKKAATAKAPATKTTATKAAAKKTAPKKTTAKRTARACPWASHAAYRTTAPTRWCAPPARRPRTTSRWPG